MSVDHSLKRIVVINDHQLGQAHAKFIQRRKGGTLLGSPWSVVIKVVVDINPNTGIRVLYDKKEVIKSCIIVPAIINPNTRTRMWGFCPMAWLLSAYLTADLI